MKNRACFTQGAFSLVEVILALGVASFCILVVFALLPVGMDTNRDSITQTTAASLSGLIVADLRGTPGASGNTAPTSPLYGIAFPLAGGGSQNTSFFLNADGSTNSVGAPSPPPFRATVTVGTPASGRAASSARVWITWPALVDPNPNLLPAHYAGSFVTVIGLDRN